jgi:hypothetical protein
LVSTLVSAVTLALGMFSCVVDGSTDRADEQQVQITVAANTRAAGVDDEQTVDDEHPGRPEDRTISTMWVGGYSAYDGQYNFYNQVDFDPDAGQGGTGTVLAKTGTHDMIFVANVDVPSPIPGNIYGLRSFAVPWTEFNNEDNIPMFFQMEDVKITVQPDASDPKPGTTDKGDPLGVEMERLAIRLDITLTLDNKRFGEWYTNGNKTITFGNVPKQVYLIPKIDNHTQSTDFPVDLKDDMVAADVSVVTGTYETTITIKRIILPELYLSDANNKPEHGLKMTIRTTHLTENWEISGVIAPRGKYAIPRNSYLDITATAKDQDFDFNVKLEEWTDKNIKHDL